MEYLDVNSESITFTRADSEVATFEKVERGQWVVKNEVDRLLLQTVTAGPPPQIAVAKYMQSLAEAAGMIGDETRQSKVDGVVLFEEAGVKYQTYIGGGFRRIGDGLGRLIVSTQPVPGESRIEVDSAVKFGDVYVAIVGVKGEKIVSIQLVPFVWL